MQLPSVPQTTSCEHTKPPSLRCNAVTTAVVIIAIVTTIPTAIAIRCASIATATATVVVVVLVVVVEESDGLVYLSPRIHRSLAHGSGEKVYTHRLLLELQ